MDKRDDTMNLEAIRDMLHDVEDNGSFDLDSIMAEFEPSAASTRQSFQQTTTTQTRTSPITEPPPQRMRPPTEQPPLPPPSPPPQPRRAPQPEEVQPPLSIAKKSKKATRAARRAAEQAEEEEEIEVRDPTQAARICRGRSRSLLARSLAVLVLAVVAAYISIAPSFEELPIPLTLNAAHNQTVAVGVLMLLQCIAIVLGIDTFGMGFSDLLQGVPSRSTLVSFSIVAALLHALSLIVFDFGSGVDIPYISISMLLLYAEMREERGRAAAQGYAYQAVSSIKSPQAVCFHYDETDDVCRAVKAPLSNIRAFLVEMERMDTADRFSMIYVPVTLSAAIIFSLIASLGRGEPTRFFWAFSAILSVATPIDLLCAFGTSYKHISKQLYNQGAAIAGARQAHALRNTEEIILHQGDLFPEGSITLTSMQNLSSLKDNELLACAASLTDTVQLEIGRILTQTVRERYGVTLYARNVSLVEGGIMGDIGSSRVIVGSSSLMVKMGVRVHAPRDDTVSLYIVIDNTLVGSLGFTYRATSNTAQAMRMMQRMRMTATLVGRDFNVSPAMVEATFDLRHSVNQLDPRGSERLLDPSYTDGDTPAAILSRAGAGSFINVLRGADKLVGSVRSALILGAFSGICGMLIVFYLLFQNAAPALVTLNLLLYQIAWYIPLFWIVLQTRI